MSLKSVCVFCGASPGARPIYHEAAAQLGRHIAERGLTLVYGGGAVGLMGVVADAALTAGGEVIGIIPQSLEHSEIGHSGLTRLEVVDGMHARKARMAELSDAFIALPGGLGTFEELFEVASWAQLGMHGKPIGLLNVEHFYQPLLNLIDTATQQGFMREQHAGLLLAADTVKALLARMRDYQPSSTHKWLDRKAC